MKGNATSSVLLIEMPFSIPLAPNPALPLLKGYLQAHGIQTDCKYWGRELFKMNRQCNFLPASTYVTLIDVPLLVGDLIFGSWLFPECHIEFEKEVGKLLSGYGIPENDKIEGLLTFEKELKKIVSRWLKEIECGNYSLIGFTITTGQLLPSLYLAKRIKAQGCQVPIVFGGSLCSKEMGISILRNFDFVDLVVDGEGEVTLCELAKKANNGEDLRGIAGTFHRSDNGKVVVNPPRPPIEDLDALPFPDYSEFFEKYCGAKDRYDIDVPIWESRGCSWNHCTFCENIGSWGRHRARSPENIVQELLFLNETYKVSNFLFYDNSLNPKGSYFEHLCDLLIEIDRDFRLVGELRATGLTKELLKKAYRAGFTEFQIGVEALDNDLLKKMGKGTKVMDNVKALRWTSQVGITLQYNLISNFPTETKQSVENTWVVFNKVKHLGMPKISPFCTLYGSPIYRDPEKFNTNIGEPASHLSRWFPKELKRALVFAAYHNESGAEQNDRRSDLWNEILREMGRSQDYYLIYRDFKTFLLIADNRDKGRKQTFILDKDERDIFILCEDAVEINNIRKQLPHLSADVIRKTLELFVQKGLVYEEGGQYFHLATPRQGSMDKER